MAAVKTVKLNTDTGFLKLIAVAAMLIDHLGARVFPQYEVMRIIGRIAFPIFAYCIAVGCIYTKNIGMYALRIGVMAVLVQPLYVTAMGHTAMMTFDWVHNFYRLDLIVGHYYLTRLNIFFTLLFGILLLWSIRDKRYIAMGLLCAFAWYMQGSLDYGLKGILLILLFYAFCDRPLTSLLWVAAFMIWWGIPTIQTRFVLSANLRMSIQFYAVLALPLIYMPFKTGIRVPKYFFYAFYPAHLALIYLLMM